MTSSGQYTTALGDDYYTFTDLEFLIRYSDLNGDGAVNYKDTKLLTENALFYEFLSAVKLSMEAISFIPPATYGPLSLRAFESWDPALKTEFIQKTNEYLTTMAVSQGVTDYRDYNDDGVVDFRDRYIFEHYGLEPVEEQDRQYPDNRKRQPSRECGLAEKMEAEGGSVVGEPPPVILTEHGGGQVQFALIIQATSPPRGLSR